MWDMSVGRTYPEQPPRLPPPLRSALRRCSRAGEVERHQVLVEAEQGELGGRKDAADLKKNKYRICYKS